MGSNGSAASPGSWSTWSRFTAPPLAGGGSGTPTGFLVIADMGADESDGGQTTAALSAELLETALGDDDGADGVSYTALLHAGDLAYNLDTDEGRVGDRFMEQIEPVASQVAYMVAPGNHEAHNNFSHYINRFSMPMKDQSHNLYYSFDIGETTAACLMLLFFLVYGRYSNRNIPHLRNRLQIAWRTVNFKGLFGAQTNLSRRKVSLVVGGGARRIELSASFLGPKQTLRGNDLRAFSMF